MYPLQVVYVPTLPQGESALARSMTRRTNVSGGGGGHQREGCRRKRGRVGLETSKQRGVLKAESDQFVEQQAEPAE